MKTQKEQRGSTSAHEERGSGKQCFARSLVLTAGLVLDGCEMATTVDYPASSVSSIDAGNRTDALIEVVVPRDVSTASDTHVQRDSGIIRDAVASRDVNITVDVNESVDAGNEAGVDANEDTSLDFLEDVAPADVNDAEVDVSTGDAGLCVSGAPINLSLTVSDCSDPTGIVFTICADGGQINIGDDNLTFDGLYSIPATGTVGGIPVTNINGVYVSLSQGLCGGTVDSSTLEGSGPDIGDFCDHSLPINFSNFNNIEANGEVTVVVSQEFPAGSCSATTFGENGPTVTDTLNLVTHPSLTYPALPGKLPITLTLVGIVNNLAYLRLASGSPGDSGEFIQNILLNGPSIGPREYITGRLSPGPFTGSSVIHIESLAQVGVSAVDTVHQSATVTILGTYFF